jgi:energy-converting hydrogenase Eha subunit C
MKDSFHIEGEIYTIIFPAAFYIRKIQVLFLLETFMISIAKGFCYLEIATATLSAH